MSFTNLALGDNWGIDQWPDFVDVGHAGSYDWRMYVPVRTCHMICEKDGSICTVWKFDCCGFEFVENKCAQWQTDLPGTVCPKCGAKVEDRV